jgi:large subunit ribosomal protein L9
VLVTVQIPKAMQVILLRDMDKLGDRFDVVAVKNGYGRNFLIPQRIAQIANKINLANLEENKKLEEAAELQRLGEYRAIASQLTSQTLKIGAKAGTSGKIFGSVTSVQIVAAIKDNSFKKGDKFTFNGRTYKVVDASAMEQYKYPTKLYADVVKKGLGLRVE